MYILLGRILEARASRAYIRTKLKEQKLEVEKAEKDCAEYGHFHSCGDFYHTALAEAKERFSSLLGLKISFEKNYKKLRLTFEETYPANIDLLK